jgi:ligand-binding SRPBCC domain-containing protein
MYTLKLTQILNTDIKNAWDFFSSPLNLGKITPASMDFNILSELPDKMYPGMIIQYTVKPLLGIPLNWVSEITQIDEPHFFIDNQIQGPYKVWHHEHHFRAIERGVEMTDILNYSLGYGILGKIAHTLFIKSKVKQIFKYRREILDHMYISETNNH